MPSAPTSGKLLQAQQQAAQQQQQQQQQQAAAAAQQQQQQAAAQAAQQKPLRAVAHTLLEGGLMDPAFYHALGQVSTATWQRHLAASPSRGNSRWHACTVARCMAAPARTGLQPP